MQIGLGVLLLLVAIVGYWGFLRRHAASAQKGSVPRGNRRFRAFRPSAVGARIWADSRVRADEVNKRGGRLITETDRSRSARTGTRRPPLMDAANTPCCPAGRSGPAAAGVTSPHSWPAAPAATPTLRPDPR
jgi:hypothetical protein